MTNNKPKLKRYNANVMFYGMPDDEGDYVLYTDYEAAQARIEKLEAEINRLIDKYDFQLLVKRNKELEAALKLCVIGEKNLNRLDEVNNETLVKILIHIHKCASEALGDKNGK